MPKWSEMLARLIPWLDTADADEHRQLRTETADIEREQQALAPFIADQTAYLMEAGQVDGFTRQLQIGFRQRTAEE